MNIKMAVQMCETSAFRITFDTHDERHFIHWELHIVIKLSKSVSPRGMRIFNRKLFIVLQPIVPSQ